MLLIGCYIALQLLSNPELIRQTVQNPIVRQLMMNPTVLNDLVTSYPQAKDWLKVGTRYMLISAYLHVCLFWLVFSSAVTKVCKN